MITARSCLILAVCYLLMPGRVGQCQGVPVPGRVYRGPEFAAKLHEFDRKYQVTSRGASDSGFVNRAVGVFSEPLDGRDPFDVVLEFFEENRELFGMRDPGNELTPLEGGRPDKRSGVIHVAFRQTLNGVSVGSGAIGGTFGVDGRLKDVASGYKKVRQGTNTVPALSVESALDAIASSRRSKSAPKASRHELVVYNAERLAWYVRTSAGEFYVDAQTGEILYWWDGKYHQSGPGEAPPPAGSPEFHDTSRQRPCSNSIAP